MSLIKCPECGHQVSSKAPTCPNCGVAIQNNIKRCPVCNGLALMDAEECPHCHAHFLVQKDEEKPGSTVMAPAAVLPPAHDSEEPAHSNQPVGFFAAVPETPASTEPPQTPASPQPPATPKKKSSPWWLLILIIILVAVGGFFYFGHQLHEATEEKDYESLHGCTEIENYQDFINRYPDSRHIESVKTRLKELQRIEDEWHTACSAQDSHKLMEFIEKNPTSVHKSMALFKIDSLDWIEADRKGTAAAYSYYIEIHEDGEHVSQAYIERDRASVREARARLDSINAAQDALRDFLPIAQSGVPAAQ